VKLAVAAVLGGVIVAAMATTTAGMVSAQSAD